jgi:hypothetical protein
MPRPVLSVASIWYGHCTHRRAPTISGINSNDIFHRLNDQQQYSGTPWVAQQAVRSQIITIYRHLEMTSDIDIATIVTQMRDLRDGNEGLS